MRALSILGLAAASLLVLACTTDGADDVNDGVADDALDDEQQGDPDASADDAIEPGGEGDAGEPPVRTDVEEACGMVMAALCEQFTECGVGLARTSCLGGASCAKFLTPLCVDSLKEADMEGAEICAEAIGQQSCDSVCNEAASGADEAPKECEPYVAAFAGAGEPEPPGPAQGSADAAVGVDAAVADGGMTTPAAEDSLGCYAECLPKK